LRVVEDWRRWRLEQDGATRQHVGASAATGGDSWQLWSAVAAGGVDGEKKWRRAAATTFCSLKEGELKK
jgi:hypothetical protein